MSHHSFFNLEALSRNISKLATNIVNNPKKVLTDQHLYAAIGFLSLLPLAKAALGGLISLLRAKSLNKVAQTYKLSSVPGESSWVLVTGATAGIGEAFCKEFAKLGFNIVAVSRSEDKLSKLKQDLLSINPSVKIRLLQVDFTKTFRYQDLISHVVNQVKDLDISILVNNVGLGECYVFHELHSAKIKNIIHTNIYPQVYLTKGLISQLKERSKTRRTAIINLSSTIGTEVMLPLLSVYSATKSFNDYFSQTLANEYPSIDILSVRPGRVKTNMNPRAKILPEKQVRAALGYLGTKKDTIGLFNGYYEANVGPSLYWLAKGFIRKAMHMTYNTKYRHDMLAQADLPLVLM